MTTDKSTTLRLRRVRFKNGKTLEVLRPKTSPSISDALAQSVTAAQKEHVIAGFALVAWGANGEVYADYNNGPLSVLLAGQVPQYLQGCPPG